MIREREREQDEGMCFAVLMEVVMNDKERKESNKHPLFMSPLPQRHT